LGSTESRPTLSELPIFLVFAPPRTYHLTRQTAACAARRTGDDRDMTRGKCRNQKPGLESPQRTLIFGPQTRHFIKLTRTPLVNREGVRCQRFGAAARREEGEYPNGSSTDEQRSSGGKDRQPSGLFSGGRLAALLLSHRAPMAMLLRRALPDARQKTAHPLPIYEMGSRRGVLLAPVLQRALHPLDSPICLHASASCQR